MITGQFDILALPTLSCPACDQAGLVIVEISPGQVPVLTCLHCGHCSTRRD